MHEDAPSTTAAAATLAELLERIESHLTRHVHFTAPAQAVVCALWTLHTHCFDQFEQSPILLVSSAVLRSGKSRLLDALEQLVARPWRAVRPSEAAVFREIEASSPTFCSTSSTRSSRTGARACTRGCAKC